MMKSKEYLISREQDRLRKYLCSVMDNHNETNMYDFCKELIENANNVGKCKLILESYTGITSGSQIIISETRKRVSNKIIGYTITLREQDKEDPSVYHISEYVHEMTRDFHYPDYEDSSLKYDKLNYLSVETYTEVNGKINEKSKDKYTCVTWNNNEGMAYVNGKLTSAFRDASNQDMKQRFEENAKVVNTTNYIKAFYSYMTEKIK